MKKRILAAVLICVGVSLSMCSCDGSSSTGGGTRDYYDANDARNTDGKFDDGEYKEALDKARDVWDANT